MDSLLVNKNISKEKAPLKPAPFLLCIISIFAYLAFLAFFEQGFPAMDPVYTQPFSDSEFFLTFALVMILGIQVFVLGYRYFQIKPNWVIATICILLFVSDVIAIISFPSSYEVTSTYSYNLSDINRVRYIFSWFAACIGFYMIFAVIPKMAIKSRQWDFLFGIGLFLAVFSVFYSYAVETDLYTNFFDATISINLWNAPASFTNNRNTYATILLLGLISSAYLHARSCQWWYFFFSLFFYLNELLVLSKTTLIASTVFYLAYLCWLYIITVRRHFIMANITLVIFLGAFLSVLIVHNIAESWPLATLQKRINAVIEALQDKGLDNVESRIVLWNIQLSAIYSDPMYIIFGFGDHNYEPLLGALFNQTESLGYAHMGILDVFGRLGVVGIVVYFSAIVHFIVLLVHGFSKKRRITFVYLITMIAFLIHGSMESTNFLSLSPTSLAFLLAAFLPLLTDDANDKRKETISYYARLYSGNTYPKKKIDWTSKSVFQLSLLCLTPLVAILIGTAPIFTSVFGHCSFDNISATITLIVVWFLAPVVLAKTFSISQKNKAVGTILFILSFGSSVVFFFLALFANNVMVPVLCALLFAIILIPTFIGKNEQTKIKLGKYIKPWILQLIIGTVILLFESYIYKTIKPSNEIRYILPIVIIISLSFYSLLLGGIGLSNYVSPITNGIISKPERRFFIRSFFSSTKADAKNELFYSISHGDSKGRTAKGK